MNQQRVQMAQHLFAEFLKGNFQPILSAVTDDVVVRLTIAEGTPLSGTFHGKQGLAEYFGRNANTVEPLAFNILNFLEGGDQVAVIGRESLRVRQSGKLMENSDWAMLCTFRGESISEILVIENTYAISEAYQQAAVA